MLGRSKWPYDENLMGKIVERKFYKNDNLVYKIILVRGDKSRKKAVYLHTSYTEQGNKISEAHINYKGDLAPLNIKGPEQRVMVTYGEYGGIIEEVFMARVWTGLFSRKWIISKVNHFTEDGLFLSAESYIDDADIK